MIFKDIKDGRFYNGDCFEAMKDIPDGVIDMVLADLPYGTTACAWDSVIPFKELWAEYWRVLKPNKAVVLTASQPFTTALIHSNIENFKYEWIWLKNRPTNFAHAKNKPMKKHENVLVFSKGTTVHETQSATRMPYFPQGLIDTGSDKVFIKNKKELTDVMFSERKSHGEFKREKTNYPNSILEFSTEMKGIHPTAKPVAFFEYLIRTYTNDNEIVLDNTAGSGTTAIAAINANRKWVCIEKEKDYYDKAIERIEKHKPAVIEWAVA